MNSAGPVGVQQAPPPGGSLSGAGLRRLPRDRWILVALIPLAFVAIFFAYPVVEMLRRSFTDFLTPAESGFSNYEWFLGSSVQLEILRRTFTSALLVTGICLVLGYPYAYLMTLVGWRWRVIMMAAVLMPFWTSVIVRNYSWIILLQDNGPVVSALEDLGLGSVRLLGTTTAVVIGMTQIMLPFMILPLYSVLSRIDRSLLLAAQSLGANPRVAFVRVYVPLSVPGIMAGSTIVFILALGFYFAPVLLGSPQNSLLSQQIVEQVSTLLAFGRGGAMALVLLILTLLLLGLGARGARPYRRALGIGSQDG
ncbi:MAG: ABC transporter permease subunit [Dehalococcoidia bacterium]|nr:ABC transporter permease subunit [Dehalococcoidia bacterium]